VWPRVVRHAGANLRLFFLQDEFPKKRVQTYWCLNTAVKFHRRLPGKNFISTARFSSQTIESMAFPADDILLVSFFFGDEVRSKLIECLLNCLSNCI
jgi:hypothetical protein